MAGGQADTLQNVGRRRGATRDKVRRLHHQGDAMGLPGDRSPPPRAQHRNCADIKDRGASGGFAEAFGGWLAFPG